MSKLVHFLFSLLPLQLELCTTPFRGKKEMVEKGNQFKTSLSLPSSFLFYSMYVVCGRWKKGKCNFYGKRNRGTRVMCELLSWHFAGEGEIDLLLGSNFRQSPKLIVSRTQWWVFENSRTMSCFFWENIFMDFAVFDV